MRPPPIRPNVRRVVIIVPSLFTLFNLFFGIWSMVHASRGEFYRASWFIVFAAILDALDGRVARLSNTGTRFGAELDSLVDIVSFGVAPAYLMYEQHFASVGAMAWILCYFYVMGVAIRLARFNVTQAGKAKSYYIGLPSPMAGMTLATYYPFTQTGLYQQLHDLNWPLLLVFLMIATTILMVSQVKYATFPRAGFHSIKGVLGVLLYLCILFFGIYAHDVFLFPLGITFMTYGLVRAAVLGLFEETRADDEEAEIAGPIVIGDADRVDDAFGPRSHGITPRGRT